MAQIRVLVAGFGPVGRAFVTDVVEHRRRLLSRYGLEVVIVGIATSRSTWLPPSSTSSVLQSAVATRGIRATLPGRHEPWDAAAAIARVEADVLVEATSGRLDTGEPATSNVRAALRRRMHVVLASKGALVRHFAEIDALASQQGVTLGVGAAVGAALPTVDLARYGLAGSQILGVEAILNGTSNHVLTRMREADATLEESLAEAKALGVAETDATADISGLDTACKLVIIANAVCGADMRLEDVLVRGIEDVTQETIRSAADRGEAVRLLGTLERRTGGWRGAVAPHSLAADHPLAGVDGLEKGITYSTDTMDRVTLVGGRSGPRGAAAALLRDIVNLHRGRSLEAASG